VARYADACNLFASQPSVVAHKLDVLERHCDAEGRDGSGIEKTIILGGEDPLADVDRFLADMDDYASMGIEKVWVNPAGPDPAAWVTRFTEQVGPRLQDL
jgi:hypothetical protein